jgi:exopolysaccharide biosynthesis polyprenyl glycosylphosphotransferase
MGGLSLGRERSTVLAVQVGGNADFALLLADVLSVALSTLLAYLLRFGWDWAEPMNRVRRPPLHSSSFPMSAEYFGFLLLYACLMVLFCRGLDLYRALPGRTRFEESVAVFEAVILATVILITSIFLTKQDISRLVVGFSAVLTASTLTGWRLFRRRLIGRRVAKGHGLRNVLIVGAGSVGQELFRYLVRNKHLGYHVRGFLDEDNSTAPNVLGRIADLQEIARAHFIDEVFVTLGARKEVVKTVVLEGRRCRLDVKVVPDFYDGLGRPTAVEILGDLPVMALHREPIPKLGLLIKRTLDIALSAAALIILSPLLAAVALAIKLDSPDGPILYRSVRVGKKGQKFTCYKFRTMVANADVIKETLRHLNERKGPFFKIAEDPRLTRIGKFLRKYSLDELPQLWNVLLGEMSVVGPRPHPLDDCQQYSLEELRRLDVTPGITGLWQVTSRTSPSFRKNLVDDVEYIENWSLGLDLRILFKTIPAVLGGTGR